MTQCTASGVHTCQFTLDIWGSPIGLNGSPGDIQGNLIRIWEWYCAGGFSSIKCYSLNSVISGGTRIQRNVTQCDWCEERPQARCDITLNILVSPTPGADGTQYCIQAAIQGQSGKERR